MVATKDRNGSAKEISEFTKYLNCCLNIMWFKRYLDCLSKHCIRDWAMITLT